jgi:molybdate transport system substrate-binding protein
VVARGEAEIGFQQVSELLEIRGVDFVGVLPEGAQRVTTFSAGLGADARQPEAARQLVRFFKSAQAEEAIRKSGLEPARP